MSRVRHRVQKIIQVTALGDKYEYADTAFLRYVCSCGHKGFGFDTTEQMMNEFADHIESYSPYD